jgi:hypothetical protein
MREDLDRPFLASLRFAWGIQAESTVDGLAMFQLMVITRTVASRYLYRAVDLHKAARTKSKAK